MAFILENTKAIRWPLVEGGDKPVITKYLIGEATANNHGLTGWLELGDKHLEESST